MNPETAMGTEITEIVAKDIRDIEATHPGLHTFLVNLAEEFAFAEVDPESELAEYAEVLIAACGVELKMSDRLMRLAIHTNGITATEKMVLLALAHHADEAAICNPSQQTVAEICGLSRKSVNETIAKLVKTGLVEIVSREGKTPTYRLHLTSADA